jgi:protein-disulfide isomerase
METRRAFLAAGAGGLAALAGCTALGGDGGDSADGNGGNGDGHTSEPTTTSAATDATGGTGGRTATPTGTPGPLGGHPAATGIGDQPALGPDPTEATATIVAFEDPSCTLCRRFELNTFPTLRSDYVEAGDLSFVYRVYPVIYPWGKPASQALESTFAAGEDAFWALKDHYYAEQSRFGTDNVFESTEAFLEAETDVDAASVVEDARKERHDAAVQADLAAGRAAEAGGQTPIFYLFRDGAFRTRVQGPQGADVFAAALEL